MPVASPLKLAAVLIAGLSVGAAALAQDAGQPARTWIDPPARGAAAPPASKPAVEAKAPAAAALPSAKGRGDRARAAAGRSGRHASRHARRAPRMQVAARPRSPHRTLVVSAVHPTRHGATRRSARMSGSRVARASAPMTVYDLPVGVVGAGAPFDDRADRIRAAQAAGYIVMHARSVQFPDGRSLRTYSPIGGERDED